MLGPALGLPGQLVAPPHGFWRARELARLGALWEGCLGRSSDVLATLLHRAAREGAVQKLLLRALALKHTALRVPIS